ncbi:MAG: hypothetical protein AB7K64_19235 [Variibacter sp.]
MPETSTPALRRTSIALVVAGGLLILNTGLLAWSSISKDAHLDTCRAQAKTLIEMMEKSLASQKTQIETIKQQAATIETLKASLATQSK